MASCDALMMLDGRSRKGAWIEIEIHPPLDCVLRSRSRKGAWIEIYAAYQTTPADDRRSRKGAWIEMALLLQNTSVAIVAPARERGLKLSS